MPIKYQMEHVFSYSGVLTPPEVIGTVPNDIRANFYVTAGEVWGPRLSGKLRPVGGDWITLRADGVCVLDVRITIEANDGALIDVAYNGILDAGVDGYSAFLRGEVPEIAQIRAAPRMRTAHPKYAWMNRTQFINIGEARLRENTVVYDVYALS